jgi:phosphoadenosine phosphosulfate reductase
VSGGKDSVVMFDLCVRHFKRVHPVLMFIVDGLSFNNKIIDFYEKKYGFEFIRVPHFMLSELLRYGSFCQGDFTVPIITIADIYSYVRKLTNTYWIAAGERISDSIIRRAMIKNSSSIDMRRGRFYPIAYWRKNEILSYIKQKRLLVSPETKYLGWSFRSFDLSDLIVIKNKFPTDYDKIKECFTFIGAANKPYEINTIPSI